MKTLNPGQLKAYKAVMSKKYKAITILGVAGAGKSHTVATIIKNYKGSIAITATTNRAKEVLAVMSGTQSFTVQSRLGFVMVKEGYKNALKQVRQYENIGLLIVEELSMLPASVHAEIEKALKAGRIESVLYLGDMVQLRAIGKGVEVDDLKSKVYTLTQQMRQLNASTEFSEYLDILRDSIINETEAPATPACADVAFYQDFKEFATAYRATECNKQIIAYRNSVVNKYNEHIHGGEELFNAGDQVIIDKPLGKARNGDIIQVLSTRTADDGSHIILTVSNLFGEVSNIKYWLVMGELQSRLDKLKADKDTEGYWKLQESSYSLKHQYACTVYKAQGSSYQEVFIDATDLWAAHNCVESKWSHPIPYHDFLRLLYVALSRTQSKCHLFVGEHRAYFHLNT